MKTIRQLADELGVSKTAIRNCMDDDFREKYTAKDGNKVITITPEGCKLISEKFRKAPQSGENQLPKTGENQVSGDMVSLLQDTIKTLQAQLTAKDEQLRVKDQQIADLTAAVKAQAQSINADRHAELAGQMQQMLPNAAAPEATAPEASEQKAKKGFWQRVLGG